MLILRYEISTTLPNPYTLDNFVTKTFNSLLKWSYFSKAIMYSTKKKNFRDFLKDYNFECICISQVTTLYRFHFFLKIHCINLVGSLGTYHYLSNIMQNILWNWRLNQYYSMMLKFFVITLAVSRLTLCSPPLRQQTSVSKTPYPWLLFLLYINTSYWSQLVSLKQYRMWFP